MPWIRVVGLFDLDLFQLLRVAGAPEFWAFGSVLAGIVLAIFGFGAISNPALDVRTIGVIAALVVGLAGGLGVARLVNVVSQTNGFLSIGAGVVAAALAESLFIAGAVAASTRPPLSDRGDHLRRPMVNHGPRMSPGWYADPEVPDFERWWDGQRWTDYRRPRHPASP